MNKKSIKSIKSIKKNNKKKTIKTAKKGGATNYLPDYNIYEIDVSEYGSNKKTHLVCNVCKNKGFMLGQSLLSSGRASSLFGLNTILDKHSQLCVCSRCTHIMMFRKNSFINGGKTIGTRAPGFSYAPNTFIKPDNKKIK